MIAQNQRSEQSVIKINPKISLPENADRIAKVETDVAKISSNMDRQYEELKRLIMCNQQTSRPQPNSIEHNEPTQPRSSPPVCHNVQRQASVSAGEQPVQTNVPTAGDGQANQQRRPPPRAPLICYYCGMTGHSARDCPNENTMDRQNESAAANGGSRKNEGCSSCVFRPVARGGGSDRSDEPPNSARSTF